jgi:hypothetical protein
MFLIKLDLITKVGIAHNMDAIQIYTFPNLISTILLAAPIQISTNFILFSDKLLITKYLFYYYNILFIYECNVLTFIFYLSHSLFLFVFLRLSEAGRMQK